MASGFNQVVLLNRLVSRSVANVREHKPPLHVGEGLLDIIENQFKLGLAIEYFDSGDAGLDEEERILNEDDSDSIGIRDFKKQTTENAVYVIMLIEFVNSKQKSFSVVHRKTKMGREIAGEEDERGASAAHVVIKLPVNGAKDDGDYRCAIEYSPYVRRLQIEKLLSRQLRRVATMEEWNFNVSRTSKSGRSVKDAEYRYHAKFQLVADIGRNLQGGAKAQLAQIVFTKRLEKQEIHGQTHVEHVDEILADMQVRISGKQAPADEEEKRSWFERIRAHFQGRGYTTKLYYRHPSGGMMSGEVDQAVAGAVDLVMCPKEYVELAAERPRWCSEIDLPFADRMKALLSDDNLWQRAQQS